MRETRAIQSLCKPFSFFGKSVWAMTLGSLKSFYNSDFRSINKANADVSQHSGFDKKKKF